VSVDCRERKREGLTNLLLKGEVFNFLFKRKNKQKITSMLHDNAGLDAAAQGAIIATAQVGYVVDVTWTTASYKAGVTWNNGVIAEVTKNTANPPVVVGVLVNFAAPIGAQRIPFTGGATGKTHSLIVKAVTEPLDEVQRRVIGTGSRPTPFETRDVATHVYMYGEGTSTRERGRDLIAYQGIMRGYYLGASGAAQDPSRTVERSFRHGVMNDLLLSLVLWMKTTQEMVAAGQAWTTDHHLAQGDHIIAALDSLFIADMQGSTNGSVATHRAELEKCNGMLRGKVKACFDEAMTKPRDKAPKNH